MTPRVLAATGVLLSLAGCWRFGGSITLLAGILALAFRELARAASSPSGKERGE